MASDEEDNTDNAYGDEFLAEDDDVSEEEDDDNQSLQFQPIDENEDVDLIEDGEEEEDVDLIDGDEEEEDEEDDSGGTATGIPTVTVATVTTPPQTTTVTVAVPVSQLEATPEVKKPLPLPLDDSRRLFQRLWTDEDEIELLQGFLDYTTQRGTNGSSHHHHDTAAFYDQIKGKLQLDFNKNQLVEKIRRLKKKYRNVLSKISSGKEYVFKSPHDQATFDISCKIWNENAAAVNTVEVAGVGMDDEDVQNANSNVNANVNSSVAFNLNDNNNNGNESEMKVPRSRKRARTSGVKIEENYEQQKPTNVTNVTNSNLVEETVKSCLLPLFKELVNNSSNGASGSSKGLAGLGLMNMNLFGGAMNFGIGDMSDEKWRKQHVLELEVYLKRLELMQDQIKAKLDELKSM